MSVDEARSREDAAALHAAGNAPPSRLGYPRLGASPEPGLPRPRQLAADGQHVADGLTPPLSSSLRRRPAEQAAEWHAPAAAPGFTGLPEAFEDAPAGGHTPEAQARGSGSGAGSARPQPTHAWLKASGREQPHRQRPAPTGGANLPGASILDSATRGREPYRQGSSATGEWPWRVPWAPGASSPAASC